MRTAIMWRDMSLTFCSEITHQLMVVRKSAKKSGTVMTPKIAAEIFEWEGWELRLLPAGHIIGLGHAASHTARRTGPRCSTPATTNCARDLSAERCELMQADTLIMETTFGLPKYRFPPLHEDVIAADAWSLCDRR
jgi:DNA ligase-1